MTLDEIAQGKVNGIKELVGELFQVGFTEKEAKQGIAKLHEMDREIITNHVETLDSLERGYVWEERKVKPELYVLASIDTFLQTYQPGLNEEPIGARPLWEAYPSNSAQSAKSNGPVVNRLNKMLIYMKDLKQYLLDQTEDIREDQETKHREYGILVEELNIRGVYALYARNINKAEGQFKTDLGTIEQVCNNALKSISTDPHVGQDKLSELFLEIDVKHLTKHYSDDKVARDVIEKMITEARMIYNALAMCNGNN